MKKLLFIALIFLFFAGCDNEKDIPDGYFVAEVFGYNLNCETCLLSFPDDIKAVKKLMGESESDIYNAVNLNKSDFEIGKVILVKLRQAEDNEIRACKTLYQTVDYVSVVVPEFSDYQNSHFIETIDLKYGCCINTYGGSTLCFDSVTNDSRCPEGVLCFWAGDATAKFKLSAAWMGYQTFELNINEDTSINNLNILLETLYPYPSVEKELKQEDYIVRLSVVNLAMVEANAKVLSFNPDKSACSWGWKIKAGNDTIMSVDGVIGNAVGFDFPLPVDVYIELGEKTRYCSESGGVDYYAVKRIVKVD